MKNNKKFVLIAVIMFILIIILLIFLYVNRGISLKNEIERTINLKSYELKVNDVFDEDILIDTTNDIGKIEYDTNNNQYSIDNVEVVEEDKVFGGKDEVLDKITNEDKYFYWYDGCNVSTDFESNNHGKLIKLLKELKDYDYKKGDNVYTISIEKAHDKKLYNAISDFHNLTSSEEIVYTSIEIDITNNYIKTITINYDGGDPTVDALKITFDKYNSVSIDIPNEIKESLAKNYFAFLTYGVESTEVFNNNQEKTYEKVDSKCINGNNSTSISIGSDSGFFNAYFTIDNCDGKTEEKKIYLKNATTDFNLKSNHDNDIYVMYDYNTKSQIGKFTYDKDGIIKVFDAGSYNGEYKIK